MREEKSWGRGDSDEEQERERERVRAGGGRGWRKSECRERMMEKWKEKEDEGGGKDRMEGGKWKEGDTKPERAERTRKGRQSSYQRKKGRRRGSAMIHREVAGDEGSENKGGETDGVREGTGLGKPRDRGKANPPTRTLNT